MELINILERKHFEKHLFPIYKDLYKFIYSIMNNHYLTEDVFQETLVKAYEKINTIRDIRKFKTWIFSIAKNESLCWIKKYNIEILSEDSYLELLTCFSKNVPEELLLKSEMKVQIKKIIKVLKPVDQKIMYLKYYRDLTLNEISLMLDMNKNTVKTRHMRAKKKIYNHIVYDNNLYTFK
ncbi:hypothetical protein ADU80_09580 [Clostridium botulinum]|uniref:RNA polymerase sigma factor n=2 Tax=Clostridium botulinum TaxID=1491 RepID=A0A9Q1UWH6_CLOBO|nr:RNA polymerase sigma factor [Clostridium botulinum]KOA75906.1 hypothetical protein ADU77_10340 [Clostridium botulinum]KOA82806.1 hypothetical protein ADU74_13045 [Clostridium botulinum]KOA84492.1 hypothetical protein ADU80_09580 [Clostridium botulinum]KOA87159.1 hypothetical protein ADU75_05035 [Clostridium botulinum]KOA91943.1 hypothetical protein ADU79_10185 [Clostridium botulinum]